MAQSQLGYPAGILPNGINGVLEMRKCRLYNYHTDSSRYQASFSYNGDYSFSQWQLYRRSKINLSRKELRTFRFNHASLQVVP